MKKIPSLLLPVSMFFFSLFLWNPASALEVNSLDCSTVDTTDGTVSDWKNISFMINTTETVAGTTYYMSADGTWGTDLTEDYVYSVNLARQANIQEMKVCNTDQFHLYLRTEEPMMFFYDRANDTYVDFWSQGGNEDGTFTEITLPADYHYWMVWKMQKADGAGRIIYMAADLTMDEGRVLNGDQEDDDRVPALYLYEESDGDVAYDDAAFDPTEDTQLTEIELSEDDQCGENSSSDDPLCAPEENVKKEDYAFEVSQDISELFKYADFAYGDTIHMSAAMYQSDSFADEEVTGVRTLFSVADETATKKYTFSKKAVQGVKAKEKKLSWNDLKKAESYQVRFMNAQTGKVIETVKGIKKTYYNFTQSLPENKVLRAIVRAVWKNNAGKNEYSAWSSGARFVR